MIDTTIQLEALKAKREQHQQRLRRMHGAATDRLLWHTTPTERVERLERELERAAASKQKG